MTWSPKFTLDLSTASTSAFVKVLEDFEIWRVAQPPRELDLTNGWKVVTPETAESMLLRNPITANRHPTLPTVKYYARQMLGGAWKKTGQPIIFNSEGIMLDAGHRLWASYFSGASFPTYLVGDVPPDPTVFAYIDNGKSRTAADALSTAGLNGLSKLLASVVSVSLHFENGCYTPSTKRPIDRPTPIEVVQYVQDHDNLRLAVRLMAGEYRSAAKILAYKDVAAFLAFRIIEIWGEEELEEFMTALGQIQDEPEEGSPVAALQKVMSEDATSVEPMKKHQVLGHAIKAFNAFVLGEHIKKLTLRVNESFPKFVVPQPTQQAAE
jgi:hypothetical protein